MPTRVGGLRVLPAVVKTSQPVTVLTTSTTQRFSSSGSSFTLSGTNASKATVTLKVGKDAWKVTIPANSSPAQAAKALQKQLPAKLSMKMTFATDHVGGPVGFELVQKGTRPISTPLPVERGSTDFKRVTESWGRTDRNGVMSSPPLWYMKWKMAGVQPPASLNGVFRAGEQLVFVVKAGKVNANFSGMIKDENGKALIVNGGKITGAQG